MMKLKPKPLGISLSLKAADVLPELRGTPFYDALKEYMEKYVELQKDLAWRLNETQEDFPVRHAQITGAGKAMQDLQKFLLTVGRSK